MSESSCYVVIIFKSYIIYILCKIWLIWKLRLMIFDIVRHAAKVLHFLVTRIITSVFSQGFVICTWNCSAVQHFLIIATYQNQFMLLINQCCLTVYINFKWHFLMDINHILIHFVLIIKYAFGTIDLFAITDSNASCHTQLNLEFDKTYTSGRVVNFLQSRAGR